MVTIIQTQTYTIAEMMALLNVSRATLRTLRLNRSVPEEIVLGTRTIRWRRAEVDAWIEEGMPVRDAWQSLVKTKRVSF